MRGKKFVFFEAQAARDSANSPVIELTLAKLPYLGRPPMFGQREKGGIVISAVKQAGRARSFHGGGSGMGRAAVLAETAARDG